MISKPQADTMGTRRDPDVSRYKTDVANTAFFEGTEYRISQEFTVEATPVVFRFTAPVDFILQLQKVTADGAGVRLRAFRSTQGTPGGTFTAVPVYKVNFMSTAPVIANANTVDVGGTFTPSGGQEAVETVRVNTSSATAQAQTISGSVGDERGLAAGTYYLVFDRIPNNGTAAAVFDLVWEERTA